VSRVKCSLAAALWLNAHTRDEYQTKEVLLAFKCEAFLLENNKLSFLLMKTTPAKVELSLKFNQVPSVRSLAAGLVAFDLEVDNGTVFTVDIKAKSWKKVKDSMAEFPQWVARVSGKLGKKTESGFKLEGARVQVFEIT
jgi:hypothetical protein